MKTSSPSRIVMTPTILAGKPAIRGTRISVELIRERVSDGWAMADILDSYPTISREDVLAARDY